MKKHVALIGTTVAVLAMGLAILVLWQTGVIFRHKQTVASADPTQERPSGQEQNNPAGKPATELRQLPVPANGKKVPGPGEQAGSTTQRDGPPSIQGGTGQPSELHGPPGPGSEAEKPVAVPEVGKDDRRYPGQGQVTKPENAPQRAEGVVPGRKEGHTDGQKAYTPVVIRLGFDPDRDQEMNVAIVHSGDRIVVKMRPAGQAGCRFYLTFGSGTLETKAYLEWSTGSPRAPATPIRDGSRISLTGADILGASVLGKLNSKGGAILKIGANCSSYRWGRFPPEDWGGYEIEMMIYQGNRWNIRPKRLL